MSEAKKNIELIECPIVLNYNFSAGRAPTQFLRSMKQGKLVGQRSPLTGKVIVPPRGACPESGQPTTEEVPLPDTGTVITFTIVYLPIPTSKLDPPFVVANLVLDGSDQTFIHLVSGCPNEDVQIGMRVKAVWKDKSEWDYSMDNISYFAPTGEPNVDIVALKASRLEEAKRHVKAKVETK
jgi:uncharacterized OB-fold protein